MIKKILEYATILNESNEEANQGGQPAQPTQPAPQQAGGGDANSAQPATQQAPNTNTTQGGETQDNGGEQTGGGGESQQDLLKELIKAFTQEYTINNLKNDQVGMQILKGLGANLDEKTLDPSIIDSKTLMDAIAKIPDLDTILSGGQQGGQQTMGESVQDVWINSKLSSLRTKGII